MEYVKANEPDWFDVAEKALAEAEAIEKAAKHFYEQNEGRYFTMVLSDDFVSTMASIAKEAP